MSGLSSNSADLGRALVLKSDIRRVVRAVATAKRARGDVLFGITLRVKTSDAKEVRLEVDDVSLDVGDLGTTDHTEGIAALIRILPLLGDQYIGICIC